jgi:hypothetical protein
MIVLCPDQRVEAWYRARLGRLTGSCAGEMLARIKTGEAAARRDLRLRLVCERLTQQSQEDAYVSKEMQRGIDLERAAFAAYEGRTGNLVERVGFLGHDALLAGCSPDGRIGNYTGIVELKVPKSATHLKYIRGNKAPAEYVPQIVHNLWITSAQWCDFVSFDDRFPGPLRLFIVRVARVQSEIDSYELMARTFLNEVDAEVEAVRSLAQVAA